MHHYNINIDLTVSTDVSNASIMKNLRLHFFPAAQIGEVHEYYTEMVALVVTSIVLQVQHSFVLH